MPLLSFLHFGTPLHGYWCDYHGDYDTKRKSRSAGMQNHGEGRPGHNSISTSLSQK